MALTASLLDFILSLLGNRAAADEYLNDPEAALENAGLGGMTCEDLDAVRPVVLDVAMVNQEGSFDRDYNTGGNSVSYGDSSNSAGGSASGGGGWGGGGGHHHGGGGGDDHANAVAQLTSIVNNYTYSTAIDDRDTITDQSVNQNIWADGDVLQLFDNEAIVASGDGAIVAGGSVAVGSFNETDNSVETDIEDSFNTDNSQNAWGSFNDNDGMDIDGDDNDGVDDDSMTDNDGLDIDGDDNDGVDDDSQNAEDSFNSEVDNSVEDNDGIDNDGGDNDGIDVDNSGNDSSQTATDSFNDNSDNSDSSTNDSNNTETELEVEVEVDIEDSFQANTETDIEESFNDNEYTVED